LIVVFAPQAAEKLCCVGDLCDAGMVCVFTQQGLQTYKATDVKIEGKMLYPLSLFRRIGEKDVSNPLCSR
jgi:hypothetical protein